LDSWAKKNKQKGSAMQEIKRLLKMVNSEIFYKVLKISDLTDEEYKLMQNFVLRENPRDKVCEMLACSRSKFRDIRNSAELKIKISLTNLLNEKIAQNK
jgi:hypothetical protein